MFIVLEGSDGAGKTTQLKLLSKKLSKNYRVKTLKFPARTTRIGKEINACLKGKRKYPPQVLSLLFSANRWEHFDLLSNYRKKYDFLILDRYYYSNIVYGKASKQDVKWLANLDKGLPQPDLVFLLDVDYRTVINRLKGKKKELYEKNENFIKKVIREYKNIARANKWFIIDSRQEKEKVCSEILNLLKVK